MNETLMQISKLDFCIQEVTLFLDTHPDDQEAMKYYNEGMKRLLKMKETYLKNGGALTNRMFNITKHTFVIKRISKNITMI